MIDKNPQALALAFKKCVGKVSKIKELGITPEIEDDSVELLIESLATAKSEAEKTSLAENVKGQRWYIEGLVKFSGMTPEEQLEAEYQGAFADTASEDEMLEALRLIAA